MQSPVQYRVHNIKYGYSTEPVQYRLEYKRTISDTVQSPVQYRLEYKRTSSDTVQSPVQYRLEYKRTS